MVRCATAAHDLPRCTLIPYHPDLYAAHRPGVADVVQAVAATVSFKKFHGLLREVFAEPIRLPPFGEGVAEARWSLG